MPSIKVSWSVLKNFEKLKGVVSHEIGHQLFTMLKGGLDEGEVHTKTGFENVKEILSCVTQLHSNGGEKEYLMWDENKDLHKIKISQYTNEDFADQFSALVEKDTKHNMACVFLEDKDNKFVNSSLVNPMEDDTHSSGDYRVLNIELGKKRNLPVSCIEFLVESKTEVQSCL